MAKPLTATAIAAFKPGSTRREIPDGGSPGLHLVIQPSGQKSWALRYRRPDKRSAKLAIGRVFDKAGAEPETPPVIGGVLTLAAARRLVAELRHEIAQGRDPGAAHLLKKTKRLETIGNLASNSFEAAARDFISQYASKKTRRWQEQARLLGLQPPKLELIPKGLSARWAKKSVAEIDGHDIYNIVDETRRRGAPGLKRRSEHPTESRARAMLSCLSKFFAWLMQHRRVTHNPCTGVFRPETPKSRERVVTDSEIIRFWSAAADERAEFSAPLKLLLLTGCRLNEVAGMRKSELDKDYQPGQSQDHGQRTSDRMSFQSRRWRKRSLRRHTSKILRAS